MSPVPVLPITDVPGLGAGHVRVIVLDAAGWLLLLERADRPTQWEPVQGTIGDTVPRESPLEAAHRELEEETGYAGPSLAWEKLAPRVWLVRLPPGAGDPQISDEHLAFRWAPPEDAEAWLAREHLYALVHSSLKQPGVAYHEAGHAVAAMHFGARIEEVTIDPGLAARLTKDASTLGVTVHGPVAPRVFWTRGYTRVYGVDPLDDAVVAAAGIAAHAYFFFLGDAAAAWDPGAEHPDVREVAACCAEAGRPTALVAMKASQFVTAHWAAIRRVAQALLTRTTLVGPEVAALLEDESGA